MNSQLTQHMTAHQLLAYLKTQPRVPPKVTTLSPADPPIEQTPECQFDLEIQDEVYIDEEGRVLPVIYGDDEMINVYQFLSEPIDDTQVKIEK